MTMSMLLMTSALVTGGDPGCDGCGSAPAVAYVAPSVGCGCDPCGGGMFSRMKSRFGGKPLIFGCGGFKKDECDPCAGPRQGLLSRLKDKLGCHDDEPCPCPAPCDPCGSMAAPVTGCALPSVPGVPSVNSSLAPQAMPHSNYAPMPYSTPNAMPQTMYSTPNAMPTMVAPSAPAAMPSQPEAMPKPTEIDPSKSKVRSTIPPVGIPSVEAPRI